MSTPIFEELCLAEEKFKDNRNSSLCAALFLGLRLINNPWSAATAKKNRQAAVSLLTYNGHARNFRKGLTPPKAGK
jgi:hypothetical protein